MNRSLPGEHPARRRELYAWNVWDECKSPAVGDTLGTVGSQVVGLMVLVSQSGLCLLPHFFEGAELFRGSAGGGGAGMCEDEQFVPFLRCDGLWSIDGKLDIFVYLLGLVALSLIAPGDLVWWSILDRRALKCTRSLPLVPSGIYWLACNSANSTS